MFASLGLTSPNPSAEFTINGRSLHDLIAEHTDPRRFPDEVTFLDPRRATLAREQIDRLLAVLEPECAGGRTALLVCPCLDLGCTALTTRVERIEEEVFWHDVVWQQQDEVWPLTPSLTLIFARHPYEAVLLEFRERCSKI